MLSLPGLIHPGGFEAAVLTRDFPWVIGLTLAMFMMAYGFRGQRSIGRWEGGFAARLWWVYGVALYQCNCIRRG